MFLSSHNQPAKKDLRCINQALATDAFAPTPYWPEVQSGLPMSRSSIITEEHRIMSRPAIHPGEILAEELAELGVGPTELARQLKVPANRISQVIRGKRSISGDTALRLG